MEVNIKTRHITYHVTLILKVTILQNFISIIIFNFYLKKS